MLCDVEKLLGFVATFLIKRGGLIASFLRFLSAQTIYHPWIAYADTHTIYVKNLFSISCLPLLVVLILDNSGTELIEARGIAQIFFFFNSGIEPCPDVHNYPPFPLCTLTGHSKKQPVISFSSHWLRELGNAVLW